MRDLHVRVPEPLLADAQARAPELGGAALVRLALARLAGWPDAAAQAVASPSGSWRGGA